MKPRVGSFRSGLLLVLFAAGCADIDPRRAEVGSAAPEYGAVALDGHEVRLSDLEGQVVLLNAWATWCEPCREEVPDLQALYEENAARGLEVVGVSVDGRGKDDVIRAFARDYGMTYPIWLDPADVFGTTFRTIGVPASLLIDREGVVRWRKPGPVDVNDPALRAVLAAALEDEA